MPIAPDLFREQWRIVKKARIAVSARPMGEKPETWTQNVCRHSGFQQRETENNRAIILFFTVIFVKKKFLFF